MTENTLFGFLLNLGLNVSSGFAAIIQQILLSLSFVCGFLGPEATKSDIGYSIGYRKR